MGAEETDCATEFWSIPNRFLKQRGRLKGLLIHGEEISRYKYPKGLSFAGANYSQVNLAVFWNISRSEIRKLE